MQEYKYPDRACRLNIDMGRRSLQPSRHQVGTPGMGNFTGAVDQDRGIAPARFGG